MTDSHIKGWWLHGKYYGYPSCCIDAFLKGNQNFHNSFVGTGFLPCNSCSKKDPNEVMKIINTNRICPTLFGENFVTEDVYFRRDLIWEASKNIEVRYD